jgi:hypothetical protein
MGDEINWDDSGFDSNALAELDAYNRSVDLTNPIYSDYSPVDGSDTDSGPGAPGTSYTGGDYPGNDGSGINFSGSDIAKFFANNPSLAGIAKVLGSVGAGKLADKLFDVEKGPGGYKGGIPTLTASRQMLPIPTTMQNAAGQTVARRPGSGGVTYFSPTRYLKPGETPEPTAVKQPTSGGISDLQKSGSGLPDGFWNDVRPMPTTSGDDKQQLVGKDDPFYQSPQYKEFQKNSANQMATMDMYNSPYFGSVSSGSVGKDMDKAYEQYKGIAPQKTQKSPATFDLSAPMYEYAAGGIANLGGYSDGGRLLRGPGDGVSDSIPAMIGKKQPARLADGEFVIPARIVSELGNGSTEAGARKLYAMMDRIKKARSKAKNIAADTKSDKHLPA